MTNDAVKEKVYWHKADGEKIMRINREDMLELTRRMTVKRSSMTRIAGAYMDREGDVDGTFNTNFLKLSPADKEKNLALAKAVPFSETNVNLKRYRFPKEQMTAGTMWQLLNGIRNSGLKNDALMDTFYDIVGGEYRSYDSRNVASSIRHSVTEAVTGTMWIFIREMRSGRIMNCVRFSGYKRKNICSCLKVKSDTGHG